MAEIIKSVEAGGYAFNEQPYLEIDEYDEPQDEWWHDCGEDSCCCADPEDNRVRCGWCQCDGHTMDVCPEREDDNA